MENALRFPALAHRSAAAHKLHNAPATIEQIRESQTHLIGASLSLFQPGAVQATVTTVQAIADSLTMRMISAG